jgi:hypothetical protein
MSEQAIRPVVDSIGATKTEFWFARHGSSAWHEAMKEQRLEWALDLRSRGMEDEGMIFNNREEIRRYVKETRGCKLKDVKIAQTFGGIRVSYPGNMLVMQQIRGSSGKQGGVKYQFKGE